MSLGRDQPVQRGQRQLIRFKTVSITIGALLAGSGAYASTNWTVGLASGPSGEARLVTASNLTIRAVAPPAAENGLYPGGKADVVVTISNPYPYPVTIIAVNLPAATTYATGYTTSALTTTQTLCLAAAPSDVIWNYATATSGSPHALTTPVTVSASGQADNPLTLTFTNDARMTATAPASCEDTYFSMPPITGVTTTGGSPKVTTSPATDGWTS